MKKIVCLGNGPVMSFTPYMAKLAQTLVNLNVYVKFVTWTRANDSTSARDPDCIETFILYESNTKNLFDLVLSYLKWMYLVFYYVLKGNEKYYICSRFENAFPLYLASFFRDVKYIYADRDALHLTYKWPVILSSVVKFIETLVAKKAVVHLIPGHSRDYTKYANVAIVPNKPSSWAYKNAFSIYESRKDNLFINIDKPIIYINGWVVKNRGLEHIVKALEENILSNRVNFIFAGDMPESIVSIIYANESCLFVGRVSNDVALSYYFDSDLVVTLYNPDIDINVLAEPNKWWDCTFTGTKFVTNFGLETVENFNGVCEYDMIDYSNVMSLHDYFSQVKIKKMQTNNFTQYSEEHRFWDEEINLVIRGFLNDC
jgi:hypothetical protein